MIHLISKKIRYLHWTATFFVTATSLTTTLTRLATSMSIPTPPLPKVNLLDLASSCVTCAEAAARVIKAIAEPNNDNLTDSQKNTRLKDDGSFVTDADFAAQGIIVQAIRSISPHIRIVGEESEEEMAVHSGKYGGIEQSLLRRTQHELRLRYHRKVINPMPLAQCLTTSMDKDDNNNNNNNNNDGDHDETDGIMNGLVDPEECYVDASRVGVVVDPLDGTKSYAQGDYDAVSILISIILDNEPYFGIIGKPFGYPEGANLTSILDRSCVIVYGGPLLRGVYIAGGKEIVPSPIVHSTNNNNDNDDDNLPRAVISSSRSMGVVQNFCSHLAELKLIHKEPLLISGAGEKSLRLILQVNNEALWFFPKKGTSLWDVAAPDAILRTLGGKLTDKFGNAMDYSKTRNDAENMEGVVACIDAKLHAQCIELFRQGDWINQAF